MPSTARRATASSARSPSTNSTPLMWSRLLRLPVIRLSATRTACPRRASSSDRCDPMKPAPPVTRYCAMRSALAISVRASTGAATEKLSRLHSLFARHLLPHETADPCDFLVGQRLVDGHLDRRGGVFGAGRSRPLPVEELHPAADIHVHGRHVHAPPDAALDERLAVRHVRAVLVIHVCPIRRHPGDGHPGDIAKQAVQDPSVPRRTVDVL